MLTRMFFRRLTALTLLLLTTMGQPTPLRAQQEKLMPPGERPDEKTLEPIIMAVASLEADIKLKREDFTVAEFGAGQPVYLHMGGSSVNRVTPKETS